MSKLVNQHRYREDDYVVWDVRNGRVIPAIGSGDDPADCVYTKVAAEKTARLLNDYVFKNAAVLGNLRVVEGPFYARPASMRDKLEGRRGMG